MSNKTICMPFRYSVPVEIQSSHARATLKSCVHDIKVDTWCYYRYTQHAHKLLILAKNHKEERNNFFLCKVFDHCGSE